VPTGAYWGLLGPIGAYWCLLVPIGAYWCLSAIVQCVVSQTTAIDRSWSGLLNRQ
jgi:hypothetical protein